MPQNSAPDTKRSTITFDPEVYRLVRARADEFHLSLSAAVNELLHEQLAEDAEDLASVEQRKDEPETPFADVLDELNTRAKP